MNNNYLIKKYKDSLNELEIKALTIAETNLESSFCIEKSIGFLEYKKHMINYKKLENNMNKNKEQINKCSLILDNLLKNIKHKSKNKNNIEENNIIVEDNVIVKEKKVNTIENTKDDVEIIQEIKEERKNNKNITMTKEKLYRQDIISDTDKYGNDEFKEDLDSLLLESAKAKSAPKWIQMLTTI